MELLTFKPQKEKILLFISEFRLSIGNLCLVQYEDGILISSMYNLKTVSEILKTTIDNVEIVEQATELMVDIIKSIGQQRQIKVKLFIRGTNFQIKVWKELVKIPFGKTTNYLKIAQAINSPSGSRAVGAAIGSNDHAYLIPCHRVLYSSGKSGHFKWGDQIKKQLLQFENPDLKFQNSLF
ncbi:MAG: methylated-DNA--[protein]-cysteine S-methyltransferase [Saprospiraceae bacterium]|nr:methylated-DNA--[protein]-cysteine S-methyltransferase [Saprospiraceae bacterium]